jgi:hypothetical protein
LVPFPVIGFLNPDDNRKPKFLACSPVLPVENILLQQGKERFRRSAVIACADSSHGPDRVVVFQGSDKLP